MRIQAVICDIYKTLLDVGAPPDDAVPRWEQLCRNLGRGAEAPTLTEFTAVTQRIIAREHLAAQAAGIRHPEIFWPTIACEAWPPLAVLKGPSLDDFLLAHAQLQRTVQLMPGAAEVLRTLMHRNVALGLISNSQPYTLRELDLACATAGLDRSLFLPDLSLLSFELGFSKPDPHIYRTLVARLARRGICPAQALVVGDRDDNDIQPARAQGFQTWHLASAGGTDSGRAGGWHELAMALTAAADSPSK